MTVDQAVASLPFMSAPIDEDVIAEVWQRRDKYLAFEAICGPDPDSFRERMEEYS